MTGNGTVATPLDRFVMTHRPRIIFILGLAAIVLALAFPVGEPGDVAEHLLLLGGAALVAFGVIIRVWAALFAGGKLKRVLITEGPYTLTRNPLYNGNILIGLGLGLLGGSPFTMAAGVLAIGVHVLTIRGEQETLNRIFGQPYRAFLARTPALWPNLSDLRAMTADTTPVAVTHLNFPREINRALRVFAVALFVAAIPEIVEHTPHF